MQMQRQSRNTLKIEYGVLHSSQSYNHIAISECSPKAFYMFSIYISYIQTISGAILK
jgi:hypothetical protein